MFTFSFLTTERICCRVVALALSFHLSLSLLLPFHPGPICVWRSSNFGVLHERVSGPRRHGFCCPWVRMYRFLQAGRLASSFVRWHCADLLCSFICTISSKILSSSRLFMVRLSIQFCHPVLLSFSIDFLFIFLPEGSRVPIPVGCCRGVGLVKTSGIRAKSSFCRSFRLSHSFSTAHYVLCKSGMSRECIQELQTSHFVRLGMMFPWQFQFHPILSLANSMSMLTRVPGIPAVFLVCHFLCEERKALYSGLRIVVNKI